MMTRNIEKLTGGTLATAAEKITAQAKEIEELKKQLEFEKELYKMQQERIRAINKDVEEKSGVIDKIWEANMNVARENGKKMQSMEKKIEIQKKVIKSTLAANTTLKHDFDKAMKSRKDFWHKRSKYKKTLKKHREKAKKMRPHFEQCVRVMDKICGTINHYTTKNGHNMNMNKKQCEVLLYKIMNDTYYVFENQLPRKLGLLKDSNQSEPKVENLKCE
jgi:predicted  nucleic acid-binding Zn-ribbon protein